MALFNINSVREARIFKKKNNIQNINKKKKERKKAKNTKRAIKAGKIKKQRFKAVDLSFPLVFSSCLYLFFLKN